MLAAAACSRNAEVVAASREPIVVGIVPAASVRGTLGGSVCHPERTREGSCLGVRVKIPREYARDDTGLT